MIMMESPSLAINSHDVPGPNYRMWETVNAAAGLTVAGLIGHIVHAHNLAVELERKGLANVVINCHGLDKGGALYIGGENHPPLDRSNVGQLAALKGAIPGTLWLVACQAANGPAGKQLCQLMATTIGCQVVAGEDDQDVGIWGSFRIIQGGGRGQIDEYEGTVWAFTVVGGPRRINPHRDILTIKE